MTIDRYCISQGHRLLVVSEAPKGDWVKHSDHEQAMTEKDARIARLEYGLNNQLKGDLHINGWGILNESTQTSLDNIKADAIDEMVNKTNCQDPAMRVVQDIIDYTNKLRSNK